MSAIINIPFNFQPVNTTGGLNTTYTVPAGRYARVVVSLDCDAYVTSVSTPSGPTHIEGTYYSSSCSAKSLSLELWLNSGDVLSFSNSPSSATLSTPSNSGNVPVANSSSSTSSVLVNGIVVGTITSRLIVSDNLANVAFNTNPINRATSGSANVAWFSSEYIKVS